MGDWPLRFGMNVRKTSNDRVVEIVHSHPCAMKLRMDGAPERWWRVERSRFLRFATEWKCKKLRNGNGGGVSGKMRGFFAPLRMTSLIGEMHGLISRGW